MNLQFLASYMFWHTSQEYMVSNTSNDSRRFAYIVIGAVSALFAISALAYKLAEPVYVTDGWHYEVYFNDVEGISELRQKDNVLYATQELRRSRGQLIRIIDGKIEVLAAGLNKPAGILFLGEKIFVTMEGGNPGLMVYSDGKIEYIEGVISGEGIATLNENLLVIEDNGHQGRLLSLNSETMKPKVLVSGLNEGEGLCSFPDGRIYYSEKGLHRVSSYFNGVITSEPNVFRKPGYLACRSDGSLLVTEDSSSQGRLLKLDASGEVSVIASFLRSPQAVLSLGENELLLAEQGRNRILRFWRE